MNRVQPTVRSPRNSALQQQLMMPSSAHAFINNTDVEASDSSSQFFGNDSVLRQTLIQGSPNRMTQMQSHNLQSTASNTAFRSPAVENLQSSPQVPQYRPVNFNYIL